MIGALLDPRCKELWFASERLKVQIQEQLRSIYKNYLDEDDDYNNENITTHFWQVCLCRILKNQTK